MNDWYELWSKGGAAPNFRIDNPEEYIKKFNWVNNWINIYFFNKVSDFILGIIFMISIFLFYFRDTIFKNKIPKVNNHVYLVYLLILILGIEWFYNHPALRYGGYHIIALLLFIPISVKITSSQIDQKKYSKTVILLVSLTVIIFLSRNINRIVNEVDQYNYKPISQTFYFLDNGHFRIQKKMDQLIEQYNSCKNKKFECNTDIKIKKVMGKIVFINQ
jgi:hypothetical protein